MSDVFSKASKWQRDRALLLHDQFARLDKRHGNFSKSLQELSTCLRGSLLDNKKPLAVSTGTLRREYGKWKKAGRCPEALLPDYKPGQQKVPDELVAELHRLATMPGIKAFSVAVKALMLRWKDGGEVPGLGCWLDWWRENHSNEPMPASAPDFPFKRSTLYNYKPAKALVAAGTKGARAARETLPFIEMDYSRLRRCELFTLDDVRLDLKAIDPATGKVVDLVAYCMMEVCSRMIGGFVLRPDGAIKQADVDALMLHVLSTFGIGDGYQTHILFERGSVACSEATQRSLEGLSGGGIKVHRTGIDSRIRWAGQSKDDACGNPYGKGCIESFNRTLHLLLNNLPGQRGSSYQNQPQNLEATISHTEMLTAIERKTGVKLEKQLLNIWEVSTCMRVAIDHYNHEQGHEFSGHGEVYQTEVQPGVWKDYRPVTETHAREALVHA
jgi:hypothetical protein